MTINKEARPEIDHNGWHADDFHANVNDDDDDDDDDNNDGLISSTDLTTLTQNRYKNKSKNSKINNNVVSLLSSQPNISGPS